MEYQHTELMLNGAGAGGSATKTPFSSLRPAAHWGNAAEICPGMGDPITGAAARNQFSGNVWFMKKELIIRLVVSFVLPVLGMGMNQSIGLDQRSFIPFANTLVTESESVACVFVLKTLLAS
jgi:hypothetical protein